MENIKISIDTSEVDGLIKKLNQLKQLLVEVTELIDSLAHQGNNCDDT